MSALTLFEALWTIVEILFCVWLFCRDYARRPHFAVRIAMSVAGLVALYLVRSWGFGSIHLLPSDHFAAQFLAFVGLLALCFVLVLVCYETSVWSALFCCTAGYTIQNIASGLHGFVMILLGYAGAEVVASSSGVMVSDPLVVVASLAGTSVAVIGAGFLLYVRHVRMSGLEEVENRGMTVAVGAVVLFEIALDLVNKGLSQPTAAGEPNDIPALFLVILKFTHLATCMLILYVQYEMLYNKRLQLDAVALERMAQDQRRHYELTRESIEAINMRCHDIRHQITSLGAAHEVSRETLERLAEEVEVYDTTVKSGNDALDVILTEKRLICWRDGITLSCLVDGASVAFISLPDLYSLFGNALDNAIEAVRGHEDQGLRSVSVVVRRKGDMVSVHVENYLAGELELSGGLPVPIKRDGRSHGLGMKSMRSVAERYGGNLTCHVQDGIFHLNVLIPVPKAAGGA